MKNILVMLTLFFLLHSGKIISMPDTFTEVKNGKVFAGDKEICNWNDVETIYSTLVQ